MSSVLVAIPLLLPLWWTVRSGLAPLCRLVSALAQRDAATLTPLPLDLRCAELQPIVGAIDGLLARARRHLEPERRLTPDTEHELRTPLAVPAEERDRAFECFFRGQGAGPVSGLGLAIVPEAARLLGARVARRR